MAALWNVDLERQLVGVMLRSDDNCRTALDFVGPEHFFDKTCGRAFEAIRLLHRGGAPVTPETVEVEMHRLAPDLGAGDEAASLARWGRSAPPSGAGHLSALVFDLFVRRRAHVVGSSICSRAEDPSYDITAIWDEARSSIDGQEEHWGHVDLTEPATDWLTDRDLRPHWTIPDLMEEQTKLLLVGGEGQGKSTTVRQVGMCASQGIHPFDTSRRFRPRRVLGIELENGSNLINRRLQELRRRVESVLDRYQQTPDWATYRMLPWSRPINLLRPADRQLLIAEIEDVRPELLTIGPLYRMYRALPNDTGGETAATELQLWLDDIAGRYGFSLIIEGHASKAERNSPRGSAAWLGWPDYGRSIDLKPGGVVWLTAFRGDRGDGQWPEAMRRGTTGLPWVQTDRDTEENRRIR